MSSPLEIAGKVTVPRRAVKDAFNDVGQARIAGRFGMWLFLASLGVLFAATVVGFLVVRVQLGQRELWPDDLPQLPAALGLSTLVLILSSVTMHLALRAIRDGRAAGLVRGLLVTAALGVVFLLVQAFCWLTRLDVLTERWAESEAWRFALSGYYVLSGLHAAHVIGGLIGLAVTTVQAQRGRYTAAAHHGVEACAAYWHFLDVVWLVLYGLLLIGA